MKFRRTCLAMCLVLMLSFINVAHAEEGIMPCYSSVRSIAASLSINDGIATATSKIIPENSRRTSIIMRLQQNNSSGTWITISTWTNSNAGGKSEVSGKMALSSGYVYRVYATGKVYNDDRIVIETINKYSTIRSYS